MSTFLIKNEDGSLEFPLASVVVRKKFPNTSFPKDMSSFSAPDMGIYQFQRNNPPQSRSTHTPVELEPVFDGEKYVQQWADGTLRPQEELDAQLEMVVGNVKRIANRKISEKYPDWKQRNMTMRAVTLNATSPLTDEEQAELVAISAAWDEIDAIRAASDTLEQELAAMPLEEAILFDVGSWAGWEV